MKVETILFLTLSKPGPDFRKVHPFIPQFFYLLDPGNIFDTKPSLAPLSPLRSKQAHEFLFPKT